MRLKKYGRKTRRTTPLSEEDLPNLSENIVLLKNYDILPAMIKCIREAREKIYIGQYQTVFLPKNYKAEVNRIWGELILKKEQGKDVRIIINQNFESSTNRKINERVATYIRRYDINGKFYAKNTRGHAKYFIADNEIVIIGSHNLSDRAIKNNFEMSVYIRNALISKAVRETFLEHWEKGIEINRRPGYHPYFGKIQNQKKP